LYFTDALEMTSKPVVDDNGNMLVVSRSARTGTQVYTGASVGKPEMQWAVGYRPEAEVFAQDSLDSYTAIPVTIEHPEKFVDAETWKDVAVGETDGAIKDGSFVRVPFTVRHSKAIKSIRDGKSQISMGYSANLEWTPGVTDAGEKYDFVMRDLKMNHLAIVDAARGGDALRIGDDSSSTQKEARTMKIVYDGLTVDLSDDAAASAFAKKLTDKADAAQAVADKATKDLADAQALAATVATSHVTTIEAKDAEIATLTAAKATIEAELADARDPAKLRDAAAEYAKVVSKAKALGATVSDSDNAATVKRNAVNARLGDAAKGWTDAQVDVSFATLSVAVADAAPDAFRQARMGMNVVSIGDARAEAEKAYAEFARGEVK
jgi:hypothetical protein